MLSEYDLRWADPATDELAASYLTARADGYATDLTEAVAEAERLLSRRPRDVGESRSGSYRILCVAPMVFEYFIVEDDKRVFITGVRYLPPHSIS